MKLKRKDPANMCIEEWQADILEWSKGNGWWKGFPEKLPASPGSDVINYIGTKLLLIHSEVSEAAEALRDGKIKMWIDPSNHKPEGVESELADTVIRIFDLAAALNMDLGNAIAVKMDYNRTRPHRHGDKKA